MSQQSQNLARPHHLKAALETNRRPSGPGHNPKEKGHG